MGFMNIAGSLTSCYVATGKPSSFFLIPLKKKNPLRDPFLWRDE